MTATPYFLSALVPQSGLMADYPIDDVIAAGTVAQIADYSGNGRTLVGANDLGLDPPQQAVELNSINGRPSIKFIGDAPMFASGAMNAKQIFIYTKYDLANNFGGTLRGLISDNSGVSTLVGSNAASSTKFANLAFGGTYTYKKSQVAYAESAQEAPFNNFELLELSLSTGFSLTNYQLGQQTNNSGRRWRGRVADNKLYSAVKTGNDLRALRLYYDLKFGAWRIAGTTLEFPDPTMGFRSWRHFKKRPSQRGEVTDTYEYADGGMDFNRRSDNVKTIWDIDYTGLSKGEMEVLDTFNDMVGTDRTFSLIDNKGVSWTGVRIMSYDSSHRDHISTDNTVTLQLVKYP